MVTVTIDCNNVRHEVTIRFDDTTIRPDNVPIIYAILAMLYLLDKLNLVKVSSNYYDLRRGVRKLGTVSIDVG